jgi:Fe2+ transport system protein FeoA
MSELKDNLKDNFKDNPIISGASGPDNNFKDNPIISAASGSGKNIKAVSDTHDGKSVILLKSAVPGKNYLIEKIIGGHGINGRLNAMGIVPKEVITVIFQTWGGPLTIAVKGVRIALGRGITHKIEVSEIYNG